MNFTLITAGGITMIPLSIIAIVALAIIIDKLFFIKKFSKYPEKLAEIIETYNFDWKIFSQELKKINHKNYYYKFFKVLDENKSRPTWWLESRASDEAKIIEKNLNNNLWILETITTSAPLLGLLGTIFGMMSSFKIIGANDIINPNGVTAGVAESLIATAFGLIIALITLCAFNYFSKIQNQIIDDLERLGTKIIEHLKIDNKIHEN